MQKMQKIVCLGDSITYGFPFGPQYSWVEYLNQVLPGEVINEGINGNTTSDMLRRMERDVLRHHPTHVVIMGGINDVFVGESFDRITWNINKMVEMAQAQNIRTILGVPTAVDDPYIEKLLVRLRDWIKDLAQQKGLDIIDFASVFSDENGKIKLELLLDDGGHPDLAGYQAMCQVIDLKVFDL